MTETLNNNVDKLINFQSSYGKGKNSVYFKQSKRKCFIMSKHKESRQNYRWKRINENCTNGVKSNAVKGIKEVIELVNLLDKKLFDSHSWQCG